jgi:L-iditol 2-dehydrogenase
LGAAGVVDATTADAAIAAREAAGPFDCVIEITGIPALIESALSAVRPGGKLVVFGGSEPGATAQFDLARLHYEDLSVRGVFHHTPATVRESLALLESSAIDVRGLVTDRMPLEATAEAMRRFDAGDTMKIAIAPGGRPPLVA